LHDRFSICVWKDNNSYIVPPNSSYSIDMAAYPEHYGNATFVIDVMPESHPEWFLYEAAKLKRGLNGYIPKNTADEWDMEKCRIAQKELEDRSIEIAKTESVGIIGLENACAIAFETTENGLTKSMYKDAMRGKDAIWLYEGFPDEKRIKMNELAKNGITDERYYILQKEFENHAVGKIRAYTEAKKRELPEGVYSIVAKIGGSHKNEGGNLRMVEMLKGLYEVRKMGGNFDMKARVDERLEASGVKVHDTRLSAEITTKFG